MRIRCLSLLRLPSQHRIHQKNCTISGFGEWYLLRLYSLFDDVLKISPIRKSIESDLGIIDKRRDFVSDEIRSSQSDLLEWIIVVLIIIEVVLEIGYLLK